MRFKKVLHYIFIVMIPLILLFGCKADLRNQSTNPKNNKVIKIADTPTGKEDQQQKAMPVVVKTKYPTCDILIAAFNVTAFGAKGDGKTDDTQAFRDALDAAKNDGGGTVFVPSGEYAFHGTIKIPDGVTLRGDWRNPDDQTTTGIGTLLKVYVGKGIQQGIPFITLGQSSGLKGIAIWYPEQDYNNIHPYPWTIKQSEGNSMTVENVTLFNSYQGIRIGPEVNTLHLIKNVYGTPLRSGIFRDRTMDVGRIQNISFRPKYWAQSGLPGAPATDEAEESVRTWMADNGEGFVSAFYSWIWVYNMTLEGYKIGFKAIPSIAVPGQKGPNGGLYGLKIFNGSIGVQLEDTNPNGIAISGSTITASRGPDPIAIFANNKFASVAQFNTVTIGTSRGNAVRLEGDGLLSFVNCIFEDGDEEAFAVEQMKGSVSIAQSEFFKADKHIHMGKEAKSATLLGNIFKGEPEVKNDASPKAELQVSNESFGFARMVTKEHKYKTQLSRPTSDILYNVKDYGAKGNEIIDDTLAIQRALDTAGKTGGTVYMPPGRYRLDGELYIPSGVELRGTFDVQHHTTNAEGSQLFAYAGKNNEKGTPLIRLAENSGVRGLTIYYPDQVWNTMEYIPYPWTIQGQGPGVWAKDVTLVNVYQGIDFATYDSTGFYIDYVCGVPLKTGVFVGNNSGEGWIENVQFNPFYWSRSPYENRPDKGETIRFNLIQTQTAFIFGYNKNIHALHTFVYGTNKGIRFIEQEGLGATSGTFLGHGSDGAETSMQIDAIGDCELIHTQLVAMTSKELKRHIVIGEKVTGTAKFFNTLLWGQYVDRSMQIDGGNILFQQTNFRAQGDTAAYITAGNVTITNSYFQKSGRNIYIAPEVKSVSIVGNVKCNDEKEDINFVNQAGNKAAIRKIISRQGKSK